METVQHIFDTVPRSNFLNVFDSQPPRLQNAVKFLGLQKTDVAKATGVSKETVRYDDRIPDQLRERLTEIAVVCELVAGFFGGDLEKAALWFKVPNPFLGDLRPIDQIRLGRYRKVLRFVQQARQASGQP